MTPEEFIGTAIITLDEVQKAREQGADRERRRIRRLIAPVLADMRHRESHEYWLWIADRVDAATRAPRKGRR